VRSTPGMQWATEILARRGATVVGWGPLGAGHQGQVLRLEVVEATGDRSICALKIYLGAGPSTPELLREEVASLRALGVALRPLDDAIGSPRVIAAEPAAGVLLMTFEDGTPLSQRVDARPLDPELALQLVQGLRRFHRVAGRPYGDFTADNVLVHGRRLVLLDPGVPDDRGRHLMRSRRYECMSFDLGYWLQDVVGKSLRLLLRSPRDWWRGLRGTLTIAAAAAGEAPWPQRLSSSREIGAVARFYLHGYGRQASWPRRAARLAVGEILIASVVLHLSSRRSGRGIGSASFDGGTV
jgi:hypothetical protein